MLSVSEFKKKYPQYNHIDDRELVANLYNTFYTEKMSEQDFYQGMGVPLNADAGSDWVPDNDYLGLGSEIVKGVGRGFTKGLLSSGAGLAEIADAATDLVGLDDLIDSGDENELIRLANEGKKAIDDSIGVGDKYKDNWLIKFGEGLGSMGSFFVPGGVAGIAGKAASGLKAAKYAATLTTSTAGVGAGADEQVQRINAARDRGVDVSDAQQDISTLLGGLVGVTESIAPLSILKKIKRFKDPVKNQEAFSAVTSALKAGTTEGLQEVVANIAQSGIQNLVYDENVPYTESLWDDFTVGGASGALLDAVTTGIFKRRSRLTKDVDRERERQFREEEDQQTKELYDRAEAAQIAAKADALAAQEKEYKKILSAEELALWSEQRGIQEQAAKVRFDPQAPYGGKEVGIPEAATEYADQLARAAIRGNDVFPESGMFNLVEEGVPGKVQYKVVHSETGEQYGEPSDIYEFSVHLMSNLNNQLLNRRINKSIIEAMDIAPEAYSPEQAESLYRIGQRLNRPSRYTITSAVLNEAADTTNGPKSPYREEATIDSLHQEQYGVPPYTHDGKKIYKDLKNLTASQQLNFDRVERGFKETNEFTLEEASQVLGDKYSNVFDILIGIREPEVEGLDFGSVGRRLAKSRKEYQDSKRTKEEVRNRLQSKNITSDLKAPEVEYVFEKIVNETDIDKMSPSQRMFLSKELKSFPIIGEPAALPDFRPKPYTRNQYDAVLKHVTDTGEGTLLNIERALDGAGSSERIKTIAASIHKDLKKAGLILDNEGNVSAPPLLPPPPPPIEEFVPTAEPYKEAVSEEARQLEKNLKKTLRGAGLNDIRIKVLDVLKKPRHGTITREGEVIFSGDEATLEQRTEGFYRPRTRTIFLALDRVNQSARDSTPQARAAALTDILNHEVIHGVRGLDLWTGKEWALLENLAKKKVVPGTGNVTFYQMMSDPKKSPYPDLNRVAQMEEAVAALIRAGKRDKALFTGKPRTLANRLFEFFERTGNAIRGTGFQSFGDVIEKLDSGEIGSRKRGEIRTLRATESRRGVVPERGIGIERDSVLAPQTGADELSDEAIYARKARLEAVGADDIIGSGDERVEAFLRAAGDNNSADLMAAEVPRGADEGIAPLDGEEAGEKGEGRQFTEPEQAKYSRRYTLDQESIDQPPLSWQTKDQNFIDANWNNRVVYQLADKFIDLKHAEEAINDYRASLGLAPILAKDSVYTGEESISGKIGEEIRLFEDERKNPLGEKIAAYNAIDEIDEFLIFRHAIERNKKMEMRDSSRDAEKKPGSGSLKTGEQLTDSFVKRKMKERYGLDWDDASQTWEGGNQRARELMDIAADVDQIVNETMDRVVIGGLIDKDSADTISNTYKYYTPLRGKAIEDDFAEQIILGSGLSTKGKEALYALGRESASESPLGHVLLSAERGIVRSLKNKEFGEKLYNLVKAHPNDSYWSIIDKDNKEYERKLEYVYMGNDPKKYGTSPKGEGNAEYLRKVVLRPTQASLDSDLIGAKIDGEQVYIRINNPRLRNAIVSMDVGTVDNMISKFGIVNRWLSMVNTTLSPSFMLGNFPRDIQTAIYNVIGEQNMSKGKAKDQKLITKIIKDTIPSVGVFWKGVRNWNEKDGTFRGNITGISSQDLADLKEFLGAGAKADWFHSRPPEDQIKTIRSMVEMAQGTMKGNFKKRFKYIMEFIEDANASVENGVRFATFKESRNQLLDAGIDRSEAVARAASLAKNLTINFNRKGMSGDAANSLFLFFNASVQGVSNLARGLNVFSKEGSRIKQGAVASLVGLGALLALRAEEESEEDPETGRSYFSQIPSYVKNRNIVIMADPKLADKTGTSNTYVGKDGKEYQGAQGYYTIPLPYGYNLFHVLGQTLFEISNDHLSVEEGAGNIVETFLSSFSPVGMSVVPTVAQPFKEIWQNKNFFGAPIYRENYPGDPAPTPASHLSMRTTLAPFKVAAETMNALLGEGSEHVSGPLDLSPDVLEHLTEFALGGMGKFGLRSVKALEKWAKDEDVKARDIPFLRRFVGEAEGDQESMVDFFEREIRVGQRVKRYDALTGKERIKYGKDNRAYIQTKGHLDRINKQLRKLRRMRKEAAALAPLSPDNAIKSAEIVRLIEDRIQDNYNNFNRFYDEKVGRTK